MTESHILSQEIRSVSQVLHNIDKKMFFTSSILFTTGTKVVRYDKGIRSSKKNKLVYTANVYRQRTDRLLFLYAIITHENV